MTKKKKIIIGIISLILAATLITTALVVILANKFKVNTYSDMTYSLHTSAKSITLDAQYKKVFVATTYENGTEIIQNNDSKYGLFSNISGTIVVPTQYDRYTHLGSDSTTNKSYFKFYNTATDNGGFVIYDEMGQKVFETELKNNYQKTTSVKIKSKEINVDKKYKTKDITEQISISNITYGTTYIEEDLYTYETWKIEDTNGIEYTNLYKITDGKKELIQTIGNNIGSQIDNTNNLASNIHFLKNGKPVFVTEKNKNITSGNNTLEIKIFNDELELENKIEITQADAITTKFRVGNFYYIQQVIDGSEDEHDFSTTQLGETAYFKLKTHKINLKNGNHSQIKTKLIINSHLQTKGDLDGSLFDINKIILNVYEIKDKEINETKLVLADSQLKFEEIDYSFSEVIKISKNRFLAKNNNKYTLIDKKFEVIADLSNYTNVFTTNDSIIASDDTYTYICNHNGMIIKRYEIGSIINVHNSDYYMIVKEDSENNVVNYYRGNKGQEYEVILTISNSDSDTIKENLSFNNVSTFIGSDYAYMLAIKNNGSMSTYSIFNFDGIQLFTFEMATQSVTPVHTSYDNHVVIKIADHVILLDK